MRSRRARAWRRSTALSRRRCWRDNHRDTTKEERAAAPSHNLDAGIRMLPIQKITADWGLMTSIKLRLIIITAIAVIMIATACGASAQQPGFLDGLFGGSDRV